MAVHSCRPPACQSPFGRAEMIAVLIKKTMRPFTGGPRGAFTIVLFGKGPRFVCYDMDEVVAKLKKVDNKPRSHPS